MKLIRSVEIAVVVPGQKRVVHRIHADRGCHFTAKHIHSMLEQEARTIDQHLSAYDFRLVELSANKFRFVGTKRADYDPRVQTRERAAMTHHIVDAQRKTGGEPHAPIDSPASAAFPTDETRSPIPSDFTTGYFPVLAGALRRVVTRFNEIAQEMRA